ncbi:hypothetical protein P6166_06445 [Stenotrophomonas sp. HITSZ_GD]|uniref:hypothetical protein n=1 Tax=Stenotrophomonas sp. HITSZ_GD TaxID=3037248 RepID=UPI00240DFBE4|nr:hypothetical protein [Stenotrophomonas sp. HITSZ_GD]MDG2524990.1 hypothetical protein [Stenotrophomonas sp. HITSZ_GD]
MPLRHFVHVVGFQVPVGDAFLREPMLVMLDRVPREAWRAVFQLCVEELPDSLLREPPRIEGAEVQVFLAQAPQRALVGEVRRFVERVNRMTFLREGSTLHGGRTGS